MSEHSWTTPVVAVTVSAPAAASSLRPSMAFLQACYGGPVCTTITCVQLRRTIDGCRPARGSIVTATVSGGFTFTTGSTTCAATSDSTGLVTLPAILVPATGGIGLITAHSEGLSLSARVCTMPD
ncbi:hypothetical protein C5C31_08775 [Rathayibacter rathayi]|uniref:Uncharacterized protein n=1 Tax=Rathayibacter rathayi TaxID=33887 RepID=A0ABD6W5G1_RATRA|nr:hypothetical protein [Rathayibacter rathayi]PPF10565.1 hypothetical protein C5C04_13210 [Rathayibacter rathayi]PPF23076.1 hypothetical protein C5C34_10055 [Rathayibacter rathayi]PPF46359.1 hypothetical protein C5C08_11745 [Rathayibacter rathayi]PPF77449.1 hypothetical protein C5C14_12535 [Rathayibacter rathayi]PPG07869.1 hypothetical protein C5C11_15980 [Rathayibacter rathayi]